MSHSSVSNIFKFPNNSSRYSEDAREIEATASKALKKINLLYDEIMSPREFEFCDRSVMNDTHENNSADKKIIDCQQSHYLKSCCSTLRELCIKCDNFISQCSSCNQCDCNVTSTQCQMSGDYLSSKNLKSSHQSIFPNDLKVKCTVPEPFSFCNKNAEWLKAKEEKIIKLKKELNSKIENELKVRVHSKPVPKNTHLLLYNQMKYEKERRKVERKEKCLEILNSTKPFNLHSERIVRAKSSSDLTQEKPSTFKAKPVPKHILSSKVSEKLRNKEEIRKILKAERAKDIMKQSSSPFSERSIPHSRSMIDLDCYNKKSNKVESKKNISEITKRLYVIKCNDTLNSWNEKVSQVNTCKKFPYHTSDMMNKTYTVPKSGESMPFYYFPVRMSNAAILREKQIRKKEVDALLKSANDLAAKVESSPNFTYIVKEVSIKLLMRSRSEILARKEREERKTKIEDIAKNKEHIDILLLSKLKKLIPINDREKEIDEKVKNFRVSQIKRKQEYEKELQEIMKRVAEQTLLLQRQSKVTKKTTTPDSSFSDGENESEQSIASNSAGESKQSKSATQSEKSISATES